VMAGEDMDRNSGGEPKDIIYISPEFSAFS
jgi:hypothetical protein